MANYRVMYWHTIPAAVEAGEGPERIRMQLGDRFQALIDAVAMGKGMAGTDAYLEGWKLGPLLSRGGTPPDVAREVAGELEEQFETIKSVALGP